MLLLDTNIFLEYLLDQERANEVTAFFHWVHQQQIPVICTHYSIHSIESTLSARKEWTKLLDFLSFIEKMASIAVYETSIPEEQKITQLVSEKNLDFDDALQYFVAKKNNCGAIVSFDHHFDKTDLARKTPADFLEAGQ